MKLITSFNINESNLSTLSNFRQFSIEGEKDAEFMLQVVNSSQEFYNFSSKSFTAAFTSENNLTVKMKSGIYNGSIKFPANASGDVYTVLILTGASEDTELGIGYGKNSYSTSITQVGDSTLTFTPLSATSSKYDSMPSNITSVGSPGTFNATKSLNWDLLGQQSDANGFGLRLIRQPIDTDWYFQTTEVISSNPLGDAVSNNTVIVSDLTDIGTGMELVYHKSTTAPAATTVITAINQSTKTITFSTNTAFEDGETMTLRAKGSSVIQKAIGANIDFSNFNASTTSATSAELTKTVREAASDNNIALNGTYGISGGGFVTMSGAGMKNTGGNAVQVVAPGEGDGSVLTEESQSIQEGTRIYFTGSTLTISVVNTFTINSHPSANKTIYLNLDNFITPGISGS
jgi:hypothetical protein